MKFKRWVKTTILLISILLFVFLIKTNVNLPINAKIFYSIIICGSLNLLAYMKY